VKTELTLTVATALSVLASLPGCGSPDRPATWAYISPVIFQPSCASGSCHSPAAAAGGLDFSTPDRGYTSLTGLWIWIVDRTKEGQPGCGPAAGTTVCEKLFRPLVTPYDPGASRLISMLRGRNAPRMPPDRPLDEADIKLVEHWILNGAKRHETDETEGPAPDGATDGATVDATDGATVDATDGATVDATDGATVDADAQQSDSTASDGAGG
jgi:hypothetical protein